MSFSGYPWSRVSSSAQPAADQDADHLRSIEPQNVLAFVGLLFEARIVAGPGVRVICGHAGVDLTRSIEHAVRRGCRSIISFGVAGGLSPHLRPGDWIVASTIVSARASHATSFALSRRLLAIVPGADYAPIIGVDAPLLDPKIKEEFHRTGAVAVDMESHRVAAIAVEHGLAFASIRVVIDPAHRRLPPSVMAGLRQDGSTDIKAVLRLLMINPSELPLYMRIVLDAFVVRKALLKMRRRLGPGLGLSDMA